MSIELSQCEYQLKRGYLPKHGKVVTIADNNGDHIAFYKKRWGLLKYNYSLFSINEPERELLKIHQKSFTWSMVSPETGESLAYEIGGIISSKNTNCRIAIKEIKGKHSWFIYLSILSGLIATLITKNLISAFYIIPLVNLLYEFRPNTENHSITVDENEIGFMTIKKIGPYSRRASVQIESAHKADPMLLMAVIIITMG